ncbi:HalOD1 output domain-containing protein [Haloarcula sp. JP-L23]|uniref:HalOD1 output domain-containing protein n=1 Tax=Haloarcula sp. JP-L23 TaxID=2716717 RepID=UPI00140F2964|nr:hypothetical protein G9465_21240 [Haloarcula sp. JP-L23]
MSENKKEFVAKQITEAIAEIEGTDSDRLDMCLYNNVSMAAIRELVAHESNAWRLQFETENHVVELAGNDTVIVDGERIRPDV